ncbi:hypothetical protein MVEN_01811100 [Mycena venus]|uniref:Uncharacterized protein n=1 Tax=Mycena venus TaxID=2733690 RepID=A0A8H6XKP5_9AGAR|nr:hypothetical protein MVEN_01811100 [Mycena venus]
MSPRRCNMTLLHPPPPIPGINGALHASNIIHSSILVLPSFVVLSFDHDVPHSRNSSLSLPLQRTRVTLAVSRSHVKQLTTNALRFALGSPPR